MLQTRSEPRTSHELAVRVFGMDSAGRPINQTACTVDISRRGARLKGLRCWSGPGETIGVRHGAEKARYKVMWIGQPGSPLEGQVGLLCVEDKYIWGIAPPVAERPVAPAAPHLMEPSGQRQPIGISPPSAGPSNLGKDARYRVSGGAKIQEPGTPAGQWTMLQDLSLGGCYLETTTPLGLGARVDVTVHVGDVQITAKGEIMVSDRSVGMGMKFTEMTPMNRQRLQTLVEELARSGAAKA